jgi:hypothetical protein
MSRSAANAAMAPAVAGPMPGIVHRRRSSLSGLCCTNLVRDSSRESSVVAGMHEQTHTRDLQDRELASLQ